MADRSYKLTLSLSDGSTINAGTITAPQGPNGANGVTFTPSVSAAGVLSWTNNGGLANPSPINIKGPKGDDAIITASDVENWGFTKNKGTVTYVAVKMNGTIKGKVTSSGEIDLGTVLTDDSKFATKQDISEKANLNGGNIFTGKQTLNSPGSDGYSINAAGYVKGSWLQASAIANKGANTGKVCVFDNSGWIYYRTPAEILAEAGGAKTSDIPDVSGKANLSGGNTFIGAQTFKDSIEFVDSNGDGVLSLGNNAIFVDPEGRGLIPVSFSGSFGLSGQVLTSQGHNTTPIWEYVTKHGYTELTNEDLNTILTPGWYRAPRNNSCKHMPISSPNEFILIVESSSSKYIQQTFYNIGILSECYIRYTNNGGTSWGGAGWYNYRLINTSGSIAGQVLTSTGPGAPVWKTPSVSDSSTKTYSDYIYADDSTTIFGNNEYGNAFIFASSDSGQGSRQTYSIYVNGVQTDILTSDPATDYVDQAVCINISRINDSTPYSFINVNVFYKNTLKTIHINDVSDSTVDLMYTDDENQTSSLYLNITKGTT